jgi:RNA polymerase sigma factor (sigma-70 family)
MGARFLRLASDERLVDLARAGSEPAFEAIFDRHHRGVLSFCRHMLGSADEAEDAVQHTFLSAYRGLGGSTREINLRPWLYTIARNRCISILRARREQPSGDLVEPATENLSVEVQRREDLRDLLRDLSRLPDDQRAALVLAELGAVSHDEIAQVLDCPREKVKALVFQARSSLTASKLARDTPCTEIREQLATLHGGSLRRNTLRRHLRDCPGCRAYRAALREQKSALALILPVAPSLGLKSAVLGSGAAGAGGAAAAGAAATAAGSSASALTAKTLVVVALAGGAGTATVSAVRDDATKTPPRAAETPPRPSGPSTSRRGQTERAAFFPAPAGMEERPGVRRRARGTPAGEPPRGLARGRNGEPPAGRARGHEKREARAEAREQRAAVKQERQAVRQERKAATQQSKVERRAAQPQPQAKRAKPPRPAKARSAPAAAPKVEEKTKNSPPGRER